ncbi:potassium channel subfamily K member 13 [Folsomia candida]|nr:potassium channel subfamily K member 13 [Folsomia candida]
MAPLPLQNPDVTKNRQGGICHFLNLQEDNVRFILLAIFLYVYLAMGAFIFQACEESGENKTRRDFQDLYDEFVRNFTRCYYPTPSKDTMGLQVTKDNKYTFGGGVDIGANTTLLTSVDDVKSVDSEESSSRSEPYRITLDGLHELLFAYGNATQAGMVWKRKRWDWVGSFHFAWTIVSTIGYGATTPSTLLGKLLIIPYGFVGCAGGLLFFNLFLERIITFLATCMRSYRLKRQKRRPCIDNDNAIDEKPDPPNAAAAAGPAIAITVVAAHRGASPSRSSTGEESIVEQPDWKPSVYWVMLCLFAMSVTVICASGTLFQQMEGWTFGESVYFSFISYSTIGLGDYVSLQQQSYGSMEMLYRIVAFVLMIFGCCCIYSLLNVTSIVIKQFLNYIIKQMDYCGECCCCTYCRCSAAKVRRRMSSKRRRPNRSLRNIRNGVGNSSNRCQVSVLNKSHAARAFTLGRHHPYNIPESPDYDCNEKEEGGHGGLNSSRFDLDERRCSGENMISIRGELSNKVSLAVMQKRLYETAQMSRHSSAYDYPGFSATSVGPLAIVTEKLGDNPV